MLPLKHFLLKFLILFLPVVSGNVFAQRNASSFQHLSIDNGLSDNRINCIIQDADGYIWIGTEDGLNKFNGHSSKIFRHSEDSFSVCSNAITCAFKDKSSRLWFGGDGLMVCNPSEEKFICYRHGKYNSNGLTNNDITAITQDENGLMWIGTRQGLFLFDEATKKFTPFLHDTTGSTLEVYRRNRIIDMVPDLKGNIWMTTIDGLHQFSIIDHQFNTFLTDTIASARTGNHISALLFDPEGRLWLSIMNSGICFFDTAKKEFTFPPAIQNIFGVGSKNILKIAKAEDGRMWFATTYEGVRIVDTKDSSVVSYRHDIFDSKSLSDNQTTTLFEDQSGMMWVGTAGRGVDCISKRPDKFYSYTLQPGKPNSLCENDISSVCETSDGDLWIGSNKGLMLFSRKENEFKCFYHDDKNNNSLSHNVVYAVATDASGNLWMGTENGLNLFIPSTGKWKHYFNNEKDPNSLPGPGVFDVVVNSKNEIWLGTSGGIAMFNPVTEEFSCQYNNDKIGKLLRAFYPVYFEDSRKMKWVSTGRSGFYQLDSALNIIHWYRKPDGFDGSTVHQFAEDKMGNIIIAADDGLYWWDCKKSVLNKFKSGEQSLNTDIKTIAVADDRSLWAGTGMGLIQVILNSENEITGVINFSHADGLQSNIFNYKAAKRLKSGELFFGGNNGFNLFNPARIIFNKTPPVVQLSSFKVFDRTISLHNLNSGKDIELGHDMNFFSFEMAALSFDHPEKNQFAYQLEGFDKEMIYCGSNHTATYTNVPPGNYILHIIASNNDGLWNKEGAKVAINIQPPYWNTNWFRLLIISLLGGIAYFIYFRRIRKVKREEELKREITKQIAEARLTALRAQMNPHFIFNSLNSIQHFISESEKENALKYLSKFSKLIRLVLQGAGKNMITIADEEAMLGFYLELEALRFSNKFEYEILVDNGIVKDITEIPTMLLQPFVENAIIHGLLNKPDRGKLEVSIQKNNSGLMCIIEDNGIGRTAATAIKNKKLLRNESLGMKLTTERMQMLERISGKRVFIKVIDLNDEKGVSSGTRVEIEIATDEYA